MPDTSQKRAVQNYRERMGRRGMSRFEVVGLDADRDLIRRLARRLAEGDAAAGSLRAAVSQTLSGDPPAKGGVLAALLRSPLVGADLALTRDITPGRKLDL